MQVGRGWRIVGVAASAAVLLAAPAHATTFVPLDDQELLQTSAVVLVGTVSAIESGLSNGSLYTYVHVQPERIIKGSVDTEETGEVVVREPGGTFAGRSQWIYGAPEFRVGERDLLFLSLTADGALVTNNLAMGKYVLRLDASGEMTAVRDLGEGAAVLLPASGGPLPARIEVRPFWRFLQQLHRQSAARARRDQPPLTTPAGAAPAIPTEFHEAFTFISTPPVRWFEPDSGTPINYDIDSTGDLTLGFTASRQAVDSALAAWTNVPTASITLQDGGTISPVALNDCSTPTSRVIFNDPFNEIQDPTGCHGILAMGGYCGTTQSTVVNGTTFNRIVIGRVTVNNGWGGCSIWNECDVAEVLTHEIGHTLGLGHSTTPPLACVGGFDAGKTCASNTDCTSNNCESTATMAAFAHFDGRCAGLEADDTNGISFIYPLTASATVAATFTPTATRTPSGSPTPTSTSSTTPTRTATVTASATASFTATAVPTGTPTSSATAVPSGTATPTVTAVPTSPPTSTATPVLAVGGQVTYYSNGLPVAGVTVNLAGIGPSAMLTDAGGQYAFSNLSPGNWSVQPQKLGDTASSVSVLDAVYVLQRVVGLRQFSSAQSIACDVSGDGAVDTIDAVLILQEVVGLLPRFPVAQSCGSDWAFVPAAAAAANQQLTSPALSAGVCQPGAIAWNPLAAPAGGQSFSGILFGDCVGAWQPGTGALAAETGTPGVHLGRLYRPRRGGGLRAPLYVTTPDGYTGLSADVSYDASRLTAVGVRLVGSARNALLAANLHAAGVVKIALAGATPLPSGAALVVEFRGSGADAPDTTLHVRRAALVR